MHHFSLAGTPAKPAICAPRASRTWLIVDVSMVLLMIGMTMIFVGTLTLSML